MKIEFIAMLIMAIILIPLALGLIHSLRTAGTAGFDACNTGGTHACGVTRMAEVAFPIPHVLVRQGTADNEVLLGTAAARPIGTVADAVLIDQPVGVYLLSGGGQTLQMIASEAITAGEDVFAAADGEVQDLPAGAGTYYRVGLALTAAASGDLVEVMPCFPEPVVVSV